MADGSILTDRTEQTRSLGAIYRAVNSGDDMKQLPLVATPQAIARWARETRTMLAQQQRISRHMSANRLWRDVRVEDQCRIRCNGLAFDETCGEPSTRCQHVEWNAGGRVGISFYYYCQKHALLAGDGTAGARATEER